MDQDETDPIESNDIDRIDREIEDSISDIYISLKKFLSNGHGYLNPRFMQFDTYEKFRNFYFMTNKVVVFQ